MHEKIDKGNLIIDESEMVLWEEQYFKETLDIEN